jgi:predicted transposase YdaD
MLFGIHGIEESTVYQGILRKGKAIGRIEEARKTLLRQGRKRLGPPNEQIEAAITALNDLDRLNDLSESIVDVTTWDELMASPNR